LQIYKIYRYIHNTTYLFNCVQNGKTDPSFTTLEKIAKALGLSIAELFTTSDEIKDVNAHDKSVMEKVSLIESLNDDEKNTIYSMLDAFIGKRKLKDALSNVLQDVK
jgi:transcriptional regulator with XRE-family HTH domain